MVGPIKKSRGLTMAEMVAAIGVTSLVLLTLMGVLIAGLDLMSRSAELTAATEVGREVMERCRAMEYDKIPTGVVFDGQLANADNFPPAPYPSVDRDGRNFQITVTSDTMLGAVKALSVTVAWEGAQPLTLQTYVHP